MTAGQAKAALERSTPYVSLGNLIALGTMVVMMVQGGILDLSGRSEAASPHEVAELSEKVSDHTHSIAELRRVNDRQDTALKSVQNRFGDRLKGIETRLNQIYQVLVKRAETEDPVVASGLFRKPDR